jgi:protein-S-isoprenylcysteine O-methyltransferase Ste14
MKPLIQKGQPLWDKLIMASFVLLFFGWLILMGLDAGRFRWSAMPPLLQWLGAAGILISMWICSRTAQANPFLANVVKIQTERGHEVVTNGPYDFVRHPLYAATLIFFPSAALTLGSWFGLAAAVPLAGVLVLRRRPRTPPEARRLCGLCATGPLPGARCRWRFRLRLDWRRRAAHVRLPERTSRGPCRMLSQGF